MILQYYRSLLLEEDGNSEDVNELLKGSELI